MWLQAGQGSGLAVVLLFLGAECAVVLLRARTPRAKHGMCQSPYAFLIRTSYTLAPSSCASTVPAG